MDEIKLTLPRDREFHEVAHFVVGGLGARLNLTYETLDDLQVAVAGLLPQLEDEGDVTLSILLGDGEIVARVGPFDPARLRAELDAGSGISLRRVLSTVADRFEVQGEWIELAKTVEAVTT